MAQAAAVEQALVVAAVGLLLASQAGLWWRSGRAAPQPTWMAAFTQVCALTVLAVYLDQAGLRPVAAGIALLAAAAVVGPVSAARATHRVAREHGTSWWRAHRHELRSALFAVEAVVAAAALVVTVSWAADRFNSDFNGKADDSLCRLLAEGAC